MPNLFLSGLFIVFILILGELAIKIILVGVAILWGFTLLLVGQAFLKVCVGKLIAYCKSRLGNPKA